MPPHPGYEDGPPELRPPPPGDSDADDQANLPIAVTQNYSEGVAVRKQIMLNYVMNQALGEGRIKDIEKKISVGLIDTLLHQELANKRIHIDYEFGVFSPDRNKIVLEKKGIPSSQAAASPHAISSSSISLNNQNTTSKAFGQ